MARINATVVSVGPSSYQPQMISHRKMLLKNAAMAWPGSRPRRR